MNKIKAALLAAMIAVPSLTMAQDANLEYATALRHYKFFDNWFVGIYGGITSPLGENVRPREFFRFDTQRANGSLVIGKSFSPSFAVRLAGNYTKQVGILDRSAIVRSRANGYSGRGYYDFKHVSAFLEAVPNFTNIFSSYKETRRFNVLGFLGVGFVQRFGLDETMPKTLRDVSGYQTTDFSENLEDKATFAARVGLGASYMLNKYFDINLEALLSVTDDGLDGIRYDDKYDGWTNLNLGLVYHFVDHYGDHRFKYRTAGLDYDLSDIQRKINDAKKDLEDAKKEKNAKIKQRRILDMTVSFIIDKYYITDVQKRNVEAVANYMKEHPGVNVTICGFADVETAYPAYNMRLSKRRVTSVFNMLVNEFGVDPNRLSIDYKGDVVQPYSLKNEWNRVVVFALDEYETESVISE